MNSHHKILYIRLLLVEKILFYKQHEAGWSRGIKKEEITGLHHVSLLYMELNPITIGYNLL